MVHKLDFIVIGAAKSATTTLYELLKDHPDLFIPKAKEVPFFSDPEVFKKGYPAYITNHFRGAKNDQKWGTITPQYLLGQESVDSKLIAQRINKELPNVKLVALLRHPVDRAYSHYKMQVQRGHENRSFDQVVDSFLTMSDFEKNKINPEYNYIGGSEYAKLLQLYYSLFPSENILIITTDELKEDPKLLIKELCAFLNINTAHTPENPKKVYRQGGSQPKIRFLTPGFLYKIPFFRLLWKHLVPQPIRKRIEYSVNLWNIRPDSSRLEKSSMSYRRLMEYYRADLHELSRLTHRDFSWEE